MITTIKSIKLPCYEDDLTIVDQANKIYSFVCDSNRPTVKALRLAVTSLHVSLILKFVGAVIAKLAIWSTAFNVMVISPRLA